MQVEQEEEQEGQGEAFNPYARNVLHVEVDVSMNLREAQEHRQYLQVALVLDILVRHLMTLLALFETVIVLVQ